MNDVGYLSGVGIGGSASPRLLLVSVAMFILTSRINVSCNDRMIEIYFVVSTLRRRGVIEYAPRRTQRQQLTWLIFRANNGPADLLQQFPVGARSSCSEIASQIFFIDSCDQHNVFPGTSRPGQSSSLQRCWDRGLGRHVDLGGSHASIHFDRHK